jgi:hypothetical protein
METEILFEGQSTLHSIELLQAYENDRYNMTDSNNGDVS